MIKTSTIVIALLFVVCSVQAQWEQTNGPVGGSTDHIIKISDHLFVNGGPGGIFRSQDDGVSWTESNNGLPLNAHCYYLTNSGTTLYASISANGIYSSADFGENWTAINSGISGLTFYTLSADGTDIYAGNSDGGFYYSADNGNTWQRHEGALQTASVRTFLHAGTKVFAAVNGDVMQSGVYVSEDKGFSWTKLSANITSINAMGGYDNTLYVSGGQPLQISRDYGVTWTADAIGSQGGLYFMNAIKASGDEVYIGASSGAIFYSNNEGQTWVTVLNSAPDNLHNSLAEEEGQLWLATNTGVYYSPDQGQTWVERNNGLRNHIITFVKVDNTNIVAGTNSGVSISTDNGISWTNETVGTTILGTSPLGGLYYGQGYKVTGTHSTIYKSLDGSNEWTPKVHLDVNQYVSTVEGDQNRVVAGVSGYGVYVSTDDGENWTLKTNSVFENVGLLCSYVKDQMIVIGAVNNIFVSNDFGDTWTASRPEGFFFYPTSISIYNSKIIVSALQGIFETSDSGVTWQRIDDFPPGSSLGNLVIHGDTYYVTTENGVYLSNNQGSNWNPVISGLTRFTTSLAVSDEYLFCGTYGGSIWKIALDELSVRPAIIQQTTEPTITNQQSIAITLDYFDILNPDNLPLTLVVSGGENFTVTDNVVTPSRDFVGTLFVPVSLYAGNQSGEPYTARVHVIDGMETPETKFQVYPNPTTGVITILNSAGRPLQVMVTDQLGQVLIRTNAPGLSEDLRMDLAALPSGFYWLKVRQGRILETFRLSKL